MVEKFVSVTRATLKGTILIGAVQDILGGLAFRAVGLDGAIFWGTVMNVRHGVSHGARRTGIPGCQRRLPPANLTPDEGARLSE